MANDLQLVTPFLWYESEAEEAARFYTEIFGGTIERTSHYGEGGPGPAGMVMTVEFTMKGTDFIALNAGPSPDFGPKGAFLVSCTSQDEVDRVWDRLAEDGKTNRCGWLADKYGIAWNIVPMGMGALIAGDDEEGARRAMQAMLAMEKLDLDALRRAYEGNRAPSGPV